MAQDLVSRIKRKFTNLVLSTDVTLPLEQESLALKDDLYDGFNEDDNDKTLVEDPPPVFCSTQHNRTSSTSSLGFQCPGHPSEPLRFIKERSQILEAPEMSTAPSSCMS